MIDTVLHLLFRCAHRHLTRPFTPLGGEGYARRESYVVCLDCTKQFTYDSKEMRIGKRIDGSHNAFVLPPGMPRPRITKFAYAFGAAVPLAALVAARMKAKKAGERQKAKPGRV